MSYKKAYQMIKSMKNKELRGLNYFKNGVPCVMAALCKELQNPTFKVYVFSHYGQNGIGTTSDLTIKELPVDFQKRFLKLTGLSLSEALALQQYNDICGKKPSHNRRYNMV